MTQFRNITKIIMVISIFVLLNTGIVFVAEAKVNHAEKAYEAGMTAYGNEEYQKAVYAFQNAIKFNEKLYKAHYMLGLALLMNGEPEFAERSLLDTISTFPKEWKAQILLGEYYGTQQNYDLAIAYYQTALENKTMPKADKATYQEKLDALIKEKDELWHVSEEEKDKILKRVVLSSDIKTWRPVVIEKYGNDLHLSYLPKEEELEGGKWKTMLDIKCQTPGLGGFSEINQDTADYFRKQGAQLTTIEQLPEARVFETKLSKKPNVHIIGRLFKTAAGFCTAQVMRQKSKFKEKEFDEWVNRIRMIDIKK